MEVWANWHSVTRFASLVLNSFIQNLLIVKSSDWSRRSRSVRLQTCMAYHGLYGSTCCCISHGQGQRSKSQRNVTYPVKIAITQYWVHGRIEFKLGRNGYLGASGQKSDLAIRFGDPDFLCQHNNSSVETHIHHVLEISLVHMCRNSVNSASGLKSVVTIVFSDHDFL